MQGEAQRMRIYSLMSEQEVADVCDPRSQRCPFYGYVGNKAAVRLAIRNAKRAFSSIVDLGRPGYPNLVCSRELPERLLLTGPRSVGKTTFAKCLARLIGTDFQSGVWNLPWVEIDGTANPSRTEIVEKIKAALLMAECPLVGTNGYYELPPLVIFIDEVHCLSKAIMEGLLKMTEANDGRFEVDDEVFDCRRITIIIATTNPSKLMETFKSRFIKIALEKHSDKEVAAIVKRSTGWPLKVCRRIATIKPIPREALSLARQVGTTADAEQCSLEKAVTLTVRDLGLDEKGISKQAVHALQVLAQAGERGLSKKNLCAQLENMDEEELTSEILPILLNRQWISISSRHKVTETGIEELVRRGLWSEAS